MGIFKRAGDIISANLNELVDKFEDPEKMLRQAIREMESSIATATTAAARSIAGEKILAKQQTQHCEQATQWRTRARSALAAGDAPSSETLEVPEGSGYAWLQRLELECPVGKVTGKLSFQGAYDWTPAGS